MPPVLQVSNLTKFYGSFKAVDDVTFSVEPGCICGFLGPNGAGKTTTIRIILDILKPSSGSVLLLGHSCALEVRQRIGYLPEEKGLYKKMKAWSVVAYFATLKGLDRKAAKQRAYELLERYGLKDFANKPTDALSKGMSQKVQMLASMAHDPEFVILDEPFSGLDPVNQQVMEDIIRDMAKRNRTVIFSTHVMQHAERLCDRVILMAKGKKIFDGTIPEAKRVLPRRVRIETEDDVTSLRSLPDVISLHELGHGNGTAPSTLPPTAASLSPFYPVEEKAGERRLSPPLTQSPITNHQLPTTNHHPNGSTQWELELRENADPQAILQLCFDRKIRLRSFNQSEPTLHDVFVRLVGPEAKEASFR